MQWVAGGIGLALVIVFLRVALWRPPALVGESPADGWHRCSGIVHIHTTLSDGGATPLEVARAAEANGIAFVGITDHNNFDAKPFEGYQGKTLVLVGSELSTTHGHFTAFGLAPPPFVFSRDPLDDIVDVHELGGFGFAAHPMSPREDLRFTALHVPGDWGIEILNGDSEWRAAGFGLARTLAFYAINRRFALLDALGPPDASLRMWDSLLALRDTVGIYGADTHGRIGLPGERFIRFPSYEALFSVARIQVLLHKPLSGDYGRDSRAVLDAIRRGRLHVGIDSLAPSDGFSFGVISRSGKRFTMGEKVEWEDGLVARISGRMPEGTVVSLLRDGQVQHRGTEGLVASLSTPGVYRVEAHVPGWTMPWVMTNAISVFTAEEHESRAMRAAWPGPSVAPEPTTILDSFDGPSAFVAESDEGSAIVPPLIRPNRGLGGGGAARLAFRLGHLGPDRPNVWCALIDRTPRSLVGAKGLAVTIRGDRVHRIWVQVRDRNPASEDEGEEWWFASIKTSREWRRVAIPFSRLRSLNPRSDGRLDLDEVQALVFVLDQAAVPPGTEGTIWIDDISTYS